MNNKQEKTKRERRYAARTTRFFASILIFGIVSIAATQTPTKAYAAQDGTTYCLERPDGTVAPCGIPTKEECKALWQFEGSKCVKEGKK
jgi:hypothetical protein